MWDVKTLRKVILYVTGRIPAECLQWSFQTTAFNCFSLKNLCATEYDKHFIRIVLIV